MFVWLRYVLESQHSRTEREVRFAGGVARCVCTEPLDDVGDEGRHINERVIDLPPGLPRLRTLRTWHAMWIQRLDEAIADAGRREAEQIRGEQARPPAPDWFIKQSLDGRADVYVHVGGCYMAGKRSRGVSQDQARRALYEQVDARPHCPAVRTTSLPLAPTGSSGTARLIA